LDDPHLIVEYAVRVHDMSAARGGKLFR
jgi:hypothetical protein